MKIVGRVSQWFDPKNYGFVHENRNGVLYSYFFHRRNLMPGEVPAPGKIARFNSKLEPKGPVATDVEIFQSLTDMARADAALMLVDSTTRSTEAVRG
jgi:hypothetical protein